MSKVKTPPNAPPNGGPPVADAPNFRSNPEVDAKIDAYIKENPKYWSFIQAMPRDRLERTVVLNEVRQLDRQQRMREGVMTRINADPKLKQAYETLVKGLPEDQREKAMVSIASRTMRSITPRQTQSVAGARV